MLKPMRNLIDIHKPSFPHNLMGNQRVNFHVAQRRTPQTLIHQR
jgi:hypothetical protein